MFILSSAVTSRRCHRPPLLKPGIERLQNRGGLCRPIRIADQEQLIAPAHDLNGVMRLYSREIAIKFPTELRQQTVVRKFNPGFVLYSGGCYGVFCQGCPLNGLPSISDYSAILARERALRKQNKQNNRSCAPKRARVHNLPCERIGHVLSGCARG